MKVAIVGISDKPDCQALDESTNTGKIVNQIISALPDIDFIKTNMVNFAPFDDVGKLRYPTPSEIDSYIPTLLSSIGDCDAVVCLGNKVAQALTGKVDNLISVKHPSYIFVYKRKELKNYIDDTVNKIRDLQDLFLVVV